MKNRSSSSLSSDDDEELSTLSRAEKFDKQANEMLANLDNEEMETAARACYEYVKDPKGEERDEYAKRICLRYLKSKKGDLELATEKVKATLQFRKDYDVEGLMTAFDDADSGLATNLQKQLSEKKFYVMGYDKEGRSTLYFIPRRTKSFDKVWHLKEAIYSMERAVACSKSRNHTINAVVDFEGFHLTKHSPPLDIAKEFLTTLRNHYAGQIHKIFLVNCPSSFSFLWKMVSPFVGTNTKSKINFVYSYKDDSALTALYDTDELPSFLAPAGTKNRELNLEEYLFELPFDESFDEVRRQR